jgi:DNA (cytosine-5)-methyltransferase 1
MTHTFIDLFSGIGGFRLGFERAGWTCVGSCENDKFARSSYEAMFDTKGEWFGEDIRKIKSEDIPVADCWTFGFPCQDISVAGYQRGLCAQRSGLYFTVLDLVKGKKESDKPRWLVAENVKNLLGIHSGWDFARVLLEMDEAGYDVFWQVLNSKDYGVPQSRERVFLIGHLRSRGRCEILPFTGENGKTLKRLVDGSQGYRVYDPGGTSVTLQSSAGGLGAKTGLYLISQEGMTVHKDKVKTRDQSTCIVATYGHGLDNKGMRTGVLEARAVFTPGRDKARNPTCRRFKEDGEPSYTLTGQDRHGVMLSDGKHYAIRRLTPRECFRLQGFPDDLYEKAAGVCSESQLYKQAGNAVTITVAEAVARELLRAEEEWK